MMDERSPAAERALDATRRLMPEGQTPTSAHWLLGLLEEDEGRPALWIRTCQSNLIEVRQMLTALCSSSRRIDQSELFDSAQSLALRLRGEMSLTTDLLFLAAWTSDPLLIASFTELGLDPQQLTADLRSPVMASATDDTPDQSLSMAESPVVMQTARILDVNLNRARESLRIIDDFARFVRNDRHLTHQTKNLRHRLSTATSLLPSGLLLSARDTPGDVGTQIETANEYSRTRPEHVAMVNTKRLQEALRSLEEFGKVINADFARQIEQMRYEAYTLERRLTPRGTLAERLAMSGLYVLLTGSQSAAALDWTVAEASAGGADVFQLREKSLSDREKIELARRMREWTRRADVLFIVNDRPDIARLVDADGVHLGQDDLDVAAARQILGPDKLVGVSTHTMAQVNQAISEGADYLGVGPTFPSRTKSFDHFPGLDFVRQVAVETSLPAFALGGIDETNIAAVVDAGLRRIAVAAAVTEQDDPRAAAVRLKWHLEGRPD